MVRLTISLRAFYELRWWTTHYLALMISSFVRTFDNGAFQPSFRSGNVLVQAAAGKHPEDGPEADGEGQGVGEGRAGEEETRRDCS